MHRWRIGTTIRNEAKQTNTTAIAFGAATCSVGVGAARTVTATFRRRYGLAVAPPREADSDDLPARDVVRRNLLRARAKRCTGHDLRHATDRQRLLGRRLHRTPVALLARSRRACNNPAERHDVRAGVVHLLRPGRQPDEEGNRKKGHRVQVHTRVSGPTTCADEVKTGTNVQLTATPKARFLHWSVLAPATAPTCALSMNSTKVVIAHLRKP